MKTIAIDGVRYVRLSDVPKHRPNRNAISGPSVPDAISMHTGSVVLWLCEDQSKAMAIQRAISARNDQNKKACKSWARFRFSTAYCVFDTDRPPLVLLRGVIEWKSDEAKP